MPLLNVLIGLPGSGKSYYGAKLLKKYKKKYKHRDTVIISSDQIRKELYGSEEVQGKASDVFKLMFDRTKEYLCNNINVIYDATNINMKKRYNLVHQLRDAVNSYIYCTCTVIAAPYDYCLYRNSNRERTVPEDVIKRMYYNFEFPLEKEGWNEISVIAPDELNKLCKKYSRDLMKFIESTAKTYPAHDNPYHKTDITTHMKLTANYAMKLDGSGFGKSKDSIARYFAALYHDIGKYKTRTEKDGITHYYNHANVGAYDMMCFLTKRIKRCETYYKIFLLIVTLINYHMKPFDWEKKCKNNNYITADIRKYFIDIHLDLLILHTCDTKCEEELTEKSKKKFIF